MKTDVASAVAEEAKLCAVVGFIRHKQRRFAEDAVKSGFKYNSDKALANCTVNASEILAIAGCCDDRTAVKIFEEYKQNEEQKENDLENETGT